MKVKSNANDQTDTVSMNLLAFDANYDAHHEIDYDNEVLFRLGVSEFNSNTELFELEKKYLKCTEYICEHMESKMIIRNIIL